MLTNREHVIALEPRDNGLMGLLLRYPYEVRAPAEYFDGIQDVKITKDMLDLAKHIVEQKSGHFDPSRFEDRYEAALTEIIEKKQKGLPIAKQKRPAGGNVVDLMEALRESIKGRGKAAARQTPSRCAARRRQPRRARHRDPCSTGRELELCLCSPRRLSLLRTIRSTSLRMTSAPSWAGSTERPTSTQCDRETALQDLSTGEYNNPVRIVPFDTRED